MRMVFPTGTGRLLDELSTDFNSFFESMLGDEAATEKVGFTPRMDFEELDNHFRFAIDLPGVEPDAIHVDLEEDHVVIHGTRHQTWDETTKGRRRAERAFGDFKRVVRMPKMIDTDGVTADYVHGVLTVTIPKAEKHSRRIAISHPGTTHIVDNHQSGDTDSGE